MAALTVLTSKRSGNGNDIAGVAAASGGDTFVNTGQEVVIIHNGSGSPVTVTFATTSTVDGLAVTDLTVVVPAGASHAVGPFPPRWYGSDGTNGSNVSMTYSSETDVDVAVLKVTPA